MILILSNKKDITTNEVLNNFKFMQYFKVYAVLLFIFFILPNHSFAHKRAKYNIVIDTDAGIDDFRALTYFMASKDYNINCITTVDGIIEPKTAANCINKLLKTYHHEGIPIGCGGNFNASKKYTQHAMPYWKSFFSDIEQREFTNAIELLNTSIKNNPKYTIIVAMGPLSNIFELLKKYPENLQKIEMILWYSDFEGYNYLQNKDAYNFMTKNHVPLKMISNKNNISLSSDIFDVCNEINTVYSINFSKFFNPQKDVTQHNSTSNYQLTLWDDFLPLYLSFPLMFDEKQSYNHQIEITPKKDVAYDILITSILNSEKPDEGVIFNEIPTSGYMLLTDINNFSQKIIEKHGYSEFKIVAITSEIHSHLGIYSIIGAKLGLRILEYLHAGLDEITIISKAGSSPPLSCLNDGLQVGTGATVGYGTFLSDTANVASPEVLVIYNNRKITFKIKQEYTEKINADVEKIIKSYGLNTELYWLKLREISLVEYWLNLSRYDIFDVSG